MNLLQINKNGTLYRYDNGYGNGSHDPPQNGFLFIVPLPENKVEIYDGKTMFTFEPMEILYGGMERWRRYYQASHACLIKQSPFSKEQMGWRWKGVMLKKICDFVTPTPCLSVTTYKNTYCYC